MLPGFENWLIASIILSLDVARRSLEEDGLFELEAPAIGEAIAEMHGKRHPFFTEYGLQFCRQFVLEDPVSTGNMS